MSHRLLCRRPKGNLCEEEIKPVKHLTEGQSVQGPGPQGESRCVPACEGMAAGDGEPEGSRAAAFS